MLAHLAHHLLTALPIPMLPFIRNEFSLDYTQSTMVISAFTLAMGISQLAAGWLADRIGPRIVMTVGICGVALAGLLVGFSQTYLMMIVFLVLMGMAAGGYHPAAAPLISASVEPEKRGRALGFHMIGGSGSFFLAPIIAAAIAATWGWRGSFIGLAAPAMVLGIIFYLFLGRWAGASPTQQVTTNQRSDTALTPHRWRRIVVFFILSMVTGGISASVNAVIPLYLVDHYGASKQTAASFMAIIWSAGLWVGPLSGYLSDRLGRLPIILVNSLTIGFATYLLYLAPYGLGIGALLLIIGITIYIRLPVSEAYIMGQTTERNRSMMFGIYYFATQETGAVLAPVMGYLIDHFGFQTSFNIASATIIVVTLLCSVFLWGSRD